MTVFLHILSFCARPPLALLAICLLLFSSLSAHPAPYEPPPGPVASRLIFATEESSLLPSGRPDPTAINQMVDAIIKALTGRKTVDDAWRSILHPKDIVGIKVSASGRLASGTRVETAKAIIRSLKAIGYPRSSLIVWDRNRDDLLACGFSETNPDYTLAWTDGSSGSGYDPETQLSLPPLGRLMWGDSKFSSDAKPHLADLHNGPQQFSNLSYFSKILSQKVTRIIHIPSLQDHYLFGVNGAITGMTIHNADNWRRFGASPEQGGSYLADIYHSDLVAGKVAVTFLDALFLQYAGGPFPAPAQTLEYMTIFASYDPVAIDTIARKLLNEARAAHRLPSLNPLSPYIEISSLSGLGISDEKKILLRRIHRWEKK